MTPSTGIVIPCFNDDADHLRQAVDSALRQDTEVNVVVVDDGSDRAETLDALASLPDEVTVLSQANAGVSAARNAGIAYLECDLIQVLDADDWLTPGFVGAGAEVIESGARIAYADMSHEGPRGWLQRTPDTVDLADMIDTNLIGSASMFRRADWEAVGGYDEELRIGSEDYEFWVRLLGMGGYAARIPGELFHHRVRDGSRTAQQRERFAEARRATRASMARNTPAVAGPALDRVDALLAENRRLREDSEWWWKRFGIVRRAARSVRSLVRR